MSSFACRVRHWVETARSIGGLDVVLMHRMALVWLVVVSLQLWPAYSILEHSSHLHWENGEEITWRSCLATWDGAHYLHLVESGYARGDKSCAFYPLWPWLIRWFSSLSGVNPIFVGLAMANLLSFAALGLFLHQVQGRYGVMIARASVALMLAFPGALFFAFIYTEALFLFLLMVFWLGLDQRRLWPICLAGFLLPLTRAIGVFALLPLGWQILEDAWSRAVCKDASSSKERAGRFLRCLIRHRLVWGAVAVLGGYATYFLVMYTSTGNPLEGFEAQQFYPNKPSVANILNLTGFLRAFLHVGELHGMTNSVIDRAIFVVFLATLPAMWRLDHRYFWWGIGAGLIPAMSNWFFSYNRFIELCFPVFIVLGHWLGRKDRSWCFWYYVVLASVLQTVFVIRYINFHWAG